MENNEIIKHTHFTFVFVAPEVEYLFSERHAKYKRRKFVKNKQNMVLSLKTFALSYAYDEF